MKAPRRPLSLLLLASALALGGCASVPAEFAAQMKHESQKYASARKTMTKAELVAKLGAPQTDDGAQAIWEIRFDSVNYDSLTVEFDGDGHVTNMTRAHGRGSANPHWRFSRSYAIAK